MRGTFRRLMARKRFDSPAHRPGGFFDSSSCLGNFRAIVLDILIIYVARYIDLWGLLLWSLQGKELAISSGGMLFHARVGIFIGTAGLIFSGVLCYAVYRQRSASRYAANPLTQEKPVAEVAIGSGAVEEPRKPLPLPLSLPERRLREAVGRYPGGHDLLWGWPLLLGLSLVFLGRTLDGSPAPGLGGILVLPSLDFFVLGKTPVSALNGLFFGSIAYAINHAISKTDRLRLAVKLMISLSVGALAILAWYALTMAMGAPI